MAALILFLSTSALALDLDEARASAVQRAVDVLQAEARADAARARSGAALAGSLPAVVAFADGSMGAGFTSFGFPRPVAWQAGVGVQGTWTVLDPARWAGAAAARRSSRGSQALLTWARIQASRDVTIAYAEAWAAAAEVAIRDVAVQDAERGAEATGSLVASGLRAPSDAARARSAAAAALAARAQARARAAGACARLQGLVRATVSGQCQLAEPRWGELPDAPAPEHPAILAAEEAWRATRAQRADAAWSLGPAVTLTGTAAEYVFQDGTGAGWSVGARAELPLISGTTWAAVSEASAEVREAEAALEAQRLAVWIGRVSSAASVEAAQESLVALEGAAAAASEAYTLTDERYQAGLDGVTGWLDARRERDEASVSLAWGQAGVGIALAEAAAAGGVELGREP